MDFKADAGAMDSKNYLRLKDKESVKGVFAGNPYEFRMHWVNGRSALCSEDSKCAHCMTGLKSSFRFRVNFIVNENGTYVAKVFEQGWTVYDTMRQLNQDYDLEKSIVKISRTGTGPTDTSYSIIPVPKGEVTPDMAAKLKAVTLQELRHQVEPERVESQKGDSGFVPEPAFNSDEEIPF